LVEPRLGPLQLFLPLFPEPTSSCSSLSIWTAPVECGANTVQRPFCTPLLFTSARTRAVMSTICCFFCVGSSTVPR